MVQFVDGAHWIKMVYFLNLIIWKPILLVSNSHMWTTVYIVIGGIWTEDSNFNFVCKEHSFCNCTVKKINMHTKTRNGMASILEIESTKEFGKICYLKLKSGTLTTNWST